MKLIEALIPPEKLEAVTETLAAVQVFRLTVGDVQGIQVQRSKEGPLSGEAFEACPMIKLEIAVNEDFLRPTLKAIVSACGESSGRIFVLPLLDTIRIRTGERGPEAI